MKKILSLFICLSCLLAVIPLSSNAWEGEELCYLFGSKASSYLTCAENLSGYFAYGEAPEAAAVIRYMSSSMKELFSQYSEQLGEREFRYRVPAEEFEAAVFVKIMKTDALLSALRSSEYYIQGDAPYYDIIVEGAYMGTSPWTSAFGYESLGNGEYAYYELSGIPHSLWEDEPYEPSFDEVEGEDYIYLPTYIRNEDGSVTYRYIPEPLDGIIRAVFKYDGENTIICSFESLPLSELPERDRFDFVYTDPFNNSDSRGELLDQFGVYFDMGEADSGVSVTVRNTMTAEEMALCDTALLEITDAYSPFFIEIEGAFDLGAGEEFIIAPPDGFDPSLSDRYTVCRISESGEVSFVEASYSESTNTFSAVISDSGIYALFYDNSFTLGDVNGDGNINAVDCNLLIRVVSGSLSEDSGLFVGGACDINGDNNINAVDMNLLIRMISGAM